MMSVEQTERLIQALERIAKSSEATSVMLEEHVRAMSELKATIDYWCKELPLEFAKDN